MWYDKESIKSEIKGVKGVILRFKPPKAPKIENLRQETLNSLNVLDTLPEQRFDRITAMTREAFKVDVVFVSLVDENRQWFKSSSWCQSPDEPLTETPRDVSFCGHCILGASDEILVVQNALKDDRFADNRHSEFDAARDQAHSVPTPDSEPGHG